MGYTFRVQFLPPANEASSDYFDLWLEASWISPKAQTLHWCLFVSARAQRAVYAWHSHSIQHFGLVIALSLLHLRERTALPHLRVFTHGQIEEASGRDVHRTGHGAVVALPPGT